MPKFQKIEKNLYRLEETGMIYVRKYKRGKGEISRSTQETSILKARQVADQILSDWMNGDHLSAEYSFEIVHLEVLKLMRSKAKKTYDDYAGHLRLHLYPYFKGTEISEVAKKWPEYVAQKKQERPDRKLQHDRKHLTRILKHAVNQGYLTRAPLLELDAAERTPAAGREFTNEEIQTILAVASQKGRLKRSRLKIELQLMTGMRNNEVRLLKWEYIAREKGLVKLPAEITKTRYERSYYVDGSLLDRVYAQRNEGSPYVFPNRWDAMKPESIAQKGWQSILKESGIVGKKHWLRHTHVTRAIRGGAAPVLVQKSVGMSDRVMKRIYLHVSENDLRNISHVVGESLKVAQ